MKTRVPIENTEAKRMLDEMAEYIVTGAEYVKEFDAVAGTEEINAAWDERSEFETIVIEEFDPSDPASIVELRKSFKTAMALVESWVGKAVEKAQAA